MLLEMLFWLVAYAAAAVVSDGLFNGFGKLIGAFSLLTSR